MAIHIVICRHAPFDVEFFLVDILFVRTFRPGMYLKQTAPESSLRFQGLRKAFEAGVLHTGVSSGSCILIWA